MNSEEKMRIMVVDDSPEVIHLLLEDLQQDFEVVAALSAEDAFQLLADDPLPNIILLDVNMPGMNGYEACEQIKAEGRLADIDVIFLTSNSETNEIAKGLAAGAVDYLTKPYVPEVLRAKLAHILRLRNQRAQLREDVRSASELVMTVISETGALGQLVNFLSDSLTVESPAALMMNLLSTLRNFNLRAIAYWNAENIRDCDSTEDFNSMLELELVERMQGVQEGFAVIGDLHVFTQGYTVLLIKNMPSDEHRRGSIQENLQIIVNCVNKKLASFLLQQKQLNHRQQFIDQVMESVRQSFSDLKQRLALHREFSIQMVGDLSEEIEQSLFNMGLTEVQEAAILSVINNSLSHFIDHLEHGGQVDGEFESSISKLSESMKTMLD